MQGVFRCDDTNRRMRLHVGSSKDAVHWDINEEPLKFQCDDAEVGTWSMDMIHGFALSKTATM